MKITFLIVGFLLTALSGCNNKDKAKQVDTTREDILGLSLDYEKKEINLVLVSKGCTRINDISFLVNNDELTVKRNRKDECKAMPEAVSFTFSFAEAGINPDVNYKVNNGFIANPNLANIGR